MSGQPPGNPNDYYYRRGGWVRRPRRRPRATSTKSTNPFAGSPLGALAGAAVLVLIVWVAIKMVAGGGSGTANAHGSSSTAAPARDAAQVAQESSAPGVGAASPSAAPTASTPQTTAASTTAYVRQYRLLMRSAPTQTSDIVATLTYNNQVTLICHTTGPSAPSFTGGSTKVWDKVTTADGTTGYVSDGWVLTATAVDQLVSAC